MISYNHLATHLSNTTPLLYFHPNTMISELSINDAQRTVVSQNLHFNHSIYIVNLCYKICTQMDLLFKISVYLYVPKVPCRHIVSIHTLS